MMVFGTNTCSHCHLQFAWAVKSGETIPGFCNDCKQIVEQFTEKCKQVIFTTQQAKLLNSIKVGLNLSPHE